MKVCLISRALPVHNKGGLEYHTWDLAKGLAQKDIKVTLLTTAHPQGKKTEENDDVKIYYLNKGQPGRYSLSYFWYLSSALNELDRSRKFALIHSQGFALMGCRRFPPKPIVVTIHGTLFSETPLYREYFQRLNWSEKLRSVWRYRWRLVIYPFYQRLLKRADRIIVDSEFTKKELMAENKTFERKIRVVPLGVSPQRYKTIDREVARNRLNISDLMFLSVGRLEKMKGIETVLNAFKLLPQRNFTYYIIGEGSQRQYLEQFCRKEGLREVKFLGNLEPEELDYYYSAADLFIYPELSQPAFGLVALEAMLYGVPVLASHTGAIPEVVSPEVGLLFQAGNPKDLTDKLSQIISAPEMLKNFSSPCRPYALSHFPFDKMIENTTEVYKELIS